MNIEEEAKDYLLGENLGNPPLAIEDCIKIFVAGSNSRNANKRQLKSNIEVLERSIESEDSEEILKALRKQLNSIK